MKIRYCFFIITSLIMAAVVNAQSGQDVVYLGNGSILKGKVIENSTGVKTTIEIVGHNIIVIPDSLIKMILLNQEIPENERKEYVSPVEMAATVNFYGGSQNSAGFTFVTSYHFPFRMVIGAGTGIEWFDHQQIPFMVDVKYYFLKGAVSPYIYAAGGYAIALSQESDTEYTEFRGGALAGTGAGLRLNFAKRNALFFSLGYRYQKTETITNPSPWSSYYPQYETIRYDEYNRMTFSLGFLFN